MSNLESRIKGLELTTGANKPESKTWVIVRGEPIPAGVKDNDRVYIVTDERAKEMLLQLMSGELRVNKPQ